MQITATINVEMLSDDEQKALYQYLKKKWEPLGEKLLNTFLAELSFPGRVKKLFAAKEIKTVRDLLKLTKSDLFSFPRVGPKAMSEIEYTLHQIGFELDE